MNTVEFLMHNDSFRKAYIGREMTTAFIMHHGIKGMHWGVRRYQYEDGSLTSAGRLRYG